MYEMKVTSHLFHLMQVPKLASAAEYFFKLGVEGKRFRPTVRFSFLSKFSTTTSYTSVFLYFFNFFTFYITEGSKDITFLWL